MPVQKKHFEVECLADGTVRITSGNFAGVQHRMAEDFLRVLQQELGGSVRIVKGHAHTHTHTHDHDHDHDHE